jgi:hypothetical protein
VRRAHREEGRPVVRGARPGNPGTAPVRTRVRGWGGPSVPDGAPRVTLGAGTTLRRVDTLSRMTLTDRDRPLGG